MDTKTKKSKNKPDSKSNNVKSTRNNDDNICKIINDVHYNDYETNLKENLQKIWNDYDKILIKEYLDSINHNITEPVLYDLKMLYGGNSETLKSYVEELIDEDNKTKQESKLYTLKYINTDTDRNVHLSFDNSNRANDKRNGFTEHGEKYGKMFKKENEKYINTNEKEIVYDELEDIQFNYKYWENICNETKTNINLFSGPTAVFNIFYSNKKNEDQFNILKQYLSVNFYKKNSMNIFISCENLCLTSKLSKQSYTVPGYDKFFYNLPCIGFDDLVITYNSNIIFCRSLISNMIKNKDNGVEFQNEFEMDEKSLTINKNFEQCDIFNKNNYSF